MDWIKEAAEELCAAMDADFLGECKQIALGKIDVFQCTPETKTAIINIIRKHAPHPTESDVKLAKKIGKLEKRLNTIRAFCSHPIEICEPMAGWVCDSPDGIGEVERVLFECACGHEFEDYRRV